jgi:hypothetical protein
LRRLAELSVDDVDEITWDSSAFHSLVIPKERKEIVQALVERHTSLKATNGIQFRDVIQGKGRSLVILLQYNSSLRSAHFINQLTFNF